MSTKTQTLSEQAYRQMEEMIITLELTPGAVVSVSDLCEQTGIGRTPLRDALQQLADERLVEIIPRRGIRITQIHLRDHLTLLETRRVLDRLVACRAARRAESLDRGALEACGTAMREAAEAGALSEFMRLDRQFDEIVVDAAQNPFAAEAVKPLHAHCRRFWYKFEARGDLRRSAQLHEQLIEAIVSADESRASDASDALIDYLEDFTRAALERV